MRYQQSINEIWACRKNRAVYSCFECIRFRECGVDRKGGEQMASKLENVQSFINSIYWPKNKRESIGRLLTFLQEINIRSINKNDSRKTRLRCLAITTKGKGSYESFDSWSVKYIDLNHVSDIFAEVYIYDEDGRGYPSKVRTDNPKISIII